MLNEYRKHAKERAEMGLPPLPLSREQTEELVKMLTHPPDRESEFILTLLRERVPPGVDEAAEVKAGLLAKVARGEVECPLISPEEAAGLLGTMQGGYCIDPLIELLEHKELGPKAADALKKMVLIFESLERVESLARGNSHARSVLESWAKAEWFTGLPAFPERLEVNVFKIPGEINTDDFSPASEASTRSDIPLHALSMLKAREPSALEEIAKIKKKGLPLAFVGDVVGTGSSRKSACNSLIWWIGEDIPFVPNKRRGGIILGGKIAPIFFGTARDSGALPIMCDVTPLRKGQTITLDFKGGRIADEKGDLLCEFQLSPGTLADEYRAGGRTWLIIGKELTNRAGKGQERPKPSVFIKQPEPPSQAGGFTLAQKMVGKACGLPGVVPDQSCQPAMSTVGSQDTTGLMTRDELKELACLKFQAPFVLQSFCHTAAYPKPADLEMHRTLPGFFIERGGFVLKPGDGIIHSWLNRTVLPDTVGTGGDSHTRFPIGLSFPAGSGLVAFAAALGSMPLDMPESVLVRFKGEFGPGITMRDAVNAIAYAAIQEGKLTVGKEGKKNVYNGRIVEIEGIPGLTVEQAYELTNSSAERSAAAGTAALDEAAVIRFLRSNAALLETLIQEGYESREALERRLEEMREWLKHPTLLKRDPEAPFADEVEVDMGKVTEPLLACPNDPDRVEPLSEHAGRPIHEVFIGSCMTNIGHFRAAARVLRGQGQVPVRLWICPPTRMESLALREEALWAVFGAAGARIEIPGCSLCMGNQGRVADETTVFSTSTRNFDNRMGKGAQVYLGSAELAAVTALLGRIPTRNEYLAAMEKAIRPQEREEVYRCLDFSSDQIGVANPWAKSAT